MHVADALFIDGDSDWVYSSIKLFASCKVSRCETFWCKVSRSNCRCTISYWSCLTWEVFIERRRASPQIHARRFKTSR